MGEDPARRMKQADRTKMAQKYRQTESEQRGRQSIMRTESFHNDSIERFYCWKMWSAAFQTSSCPLSILRYCSHTHSFHLSLFYSIFEYIEITHSNNSSYKHSRSDSNVLINNGGVIFKFQLLVLNKY